MEAIIKRISGHHSIGQQLAAVTAVVLFPTLWLAIDHPSFEDLTIYVESLRNPASNGGLYGYRNSHGGGFTYPPLAAIVLKPLTLLSMPLSVLGVFWDSFLVIVIASGCILIARRNRLSGWWRVALLVVSIVGQPTRDALHFGQLSPIVGFLAVCISWPSRLAAPSVALAASLKITPAALWPVLALNRRWQVTATSVAAFGALTCLAWLLLPHQSYTYWTHLLWDNGRVGDVASLGNNSLKGLIARHISENPGQLWADLLWIACSLGCLMLTLSSARRNKPSPSSQQRMIVCGYLLALIASPISWTHHATFIPAISLIGLREAQGSGSRRAAAAVVLLSWILPIYDLAKLAAAFNPALGAFVADLRPITLILLLLLFSRAPDRAHTPKSS